MNCVLIKNGRAHEIWPDTVKKELVSRFTSEVLNSIVETTAIVRLGYKWDGNEFIPPIQAVVRVANGEFANSDGLLQVSSEIPIQQQPTGYTVVNISTIPDPRLEKWNGSAVVAKTRAEIDYYDAARKDSLVQAMDNNPLIQALAKLDYEERQKLQVKSGQKLRTPDECRTRLKELYIGLL